MGGDGRLLTSEVDHLQVLGLGLIQTESSQSQIRLRRTDLIESGNALNSQGRYIAWKASIQIVPRADRWSPASERRLNV